jgi:hypothetical protein
LARYWVGGTASWDGTAGTKWAATSGGAGGESVPTTADDVFFDANSSGTCTIVAGNTGAKSINCTGFTGGIAGIGPIIVSGSITLDAGQTYTHTGTMTINGTGTLTTAGKTFSAVTVNGDGITVTLGDALNTATRIITVTQGTFNTANFSITGSALISSTTNIRTISLGSSTVTLSGSTPVNYLSSTGLTFNAGTSTISSTNTADVNFEGGDQTFYNVSFETLTFTRIFGSNTFNNLSFAGRTTAGIATAFFYEDTIVNGTLTFTTGTNVTMRRYVRSIDVGVAKTLTCNAVATLTDIDFSDITFSGNCISGGSLTGTRLGNGKGNTNITFSAPKTVYYRATSNASWGATTSWSLTSGGASTVDAFPLAQDTAVFPAATYPSSGATTTINASYLFTTIDMSLRTSNTMTLAITGSPTIFGDWINGTGITITNASATLNFTGRTAQIITTLGKTFGGNRGINVDSPSGSVTLDGELICGAMTVIQGTFDTANYNVTASFLTSNNTNIRTIKLGSSTVTLSGSVNFTEATNLTFTAGTSQLNLSAATTNLAGGSQTFHNVSFTGTAEGTRVITGENTFNDLTTNASATGLSQLAINGDQTVNGTFTCAGSSATQRGFVLSNVIGTTRTITANTISANDCDFRDITIAGAAAPISPTRAGDCGGNSNITFPAAKNCFRVGTDTTWAGSSSWALTSGGTGSNDNFPLAQDTAVIDDNTTLTGTLNLTTYNVGTLDASNRTTGITLNHNAATNRYGAYTLGSGVTVSGTGTQTFSGRGTQTFTSAGKTITFSITVATPTGAFELGDAFVSSNTITHTRGTFDAKNYNLTCTTFSSSNSNTRTITMGSGLWTLSGNGPVWSLLNAIGLTFNKDTADILLSNTTTVNRTFNGGSLTYNKLTIGGATGTSTLTIAQANTFGELASTKTVAHTIALNVGAIGLTIDTWSVTGTSGNVVTVNSNVAGSRRTINLNNTTSGIDFLDVRDIGITDPNKFYVGDNSIDSGNNLNVIFTEAPPPGTIVVVTGVQATGTVGDVTPQSNNNLQVTGLQATGAVGDVIVTAKATQQVTGVEATGVVGDVIVVLGVVQQVTGAQATATTGTVTTISNNNLQVTGVQATGAVGNVLVSAKASHQVTEVEATATLGTVTVNAKATQQVTGAQATATTGTVTTIPNNNLQVTGVQATGAVGVVTIPITTNIQVTGVQATGTVGNVLVGIGVSQQVTGVEATGSVGDVTTTAKANQLITGVQTTGAVGDVTTISNNNLQVTGLQATGVIGNVVVAAASNTLTTGVSASTALGTVDVTAQATIFLSGLTLTGRVSTPLVWGPVNDQQIPNWQDINDTQVTNWNDVVV